MGEDKLRALLHAGYAKVSLRTAGAAAKVATEVPETSEELCQAPLPQNQDLGKQPVARSNY